MLPNLDMVYACFMQVCDWPKVLFPNWSFYKTILNMPEFGRGPVVKVDTLQIATLFLACAKNVYVFISDCMQYFYLIISKCYADKTSLSVGSTTITPPQGSYSFRTSFELRRKCELGTGSAEQSHNTDMIIGSHLHPKPMYCETRYGFWLNLICDVPVLGS